MDTPIAIQTIKLHKAFGKFKAINNLSLTVQEGEIFGFLGPNGAGKTTTIKLLLNMLQPTTGNAQVIGLDPRTHSVEINRKIGFLAGDMELYNNLTGAQYCNFLAALKGGVSPQKITELTKRLEANLNKRIGTLSRGNKQKIGLIAALMHDPELLILDEPTSGLDPLIQEQFNELMKEHRARGKTAFISSHILSEVQQLCDRVGFMRNGELVETVNVAELLEKSIKIVNIYFKHEVSKEKVSLLKGMKIHTQTELKIVLEYSGASTELLDWLRKLPVGDLTIESANLDDTFLRLYSKEEGSS